MDVVHADQFLTLDETGLGGAGSSSATSTHPIEHISEPGNGSGLFDERVTKDLIPLGVTVEVLRNRSVKDVRIKHGGAPTSSATGAGTSIFGSNGFAFLPNHLWSGDARVESTSNGLDAITPDKSLTVSGEGGEVFLVTKPRTFPPPCAYINRTTSADHETARRHAKCKPWNVPSGM